MNLTIHVPDEQEPALKARAHAQGLSPEEFIGQVLAHELEESASELDSLADEQKPVRDLKRPIWEVITERVAPQERGNEGILSPKNSLLRSGRKGDTSPPNGSCKVTEKELSCLQM